MYEKFRNEYSAIASERGIPMEALKDALRILDEVAVNYDFRPRELSLVPYNHELPEIAKMYIVCKKIQGLSDRTLEVYKRMLGIFFRAMQKPVEKITANDIRAYLFNYQQSRGCSNRSLDKYRGQLSSFFSWASDEGYLDRNPMKTIPPIKYEKKPRQNLSQLELEYLRTACETPRERAIIEFLFSTGCRVSELARVKKSDIEKVFEYLDGNMSAHVDLHGVLEEAFTSGQNKGIRCKFFTVDLYKKGTMHIKFHSQALVDRFNIYCCQKKNWLPPHYGRTAYKDMDAESRAVVDGFNGDGTEGSGAEAYALIMARPGYFLAEPGGRVLALPGA